MNTKIIDILNYIRYHPETNLEEITDNAKTMNITKATTLKILMTLLENNIIVLKDKKYSLSLTFCKSIQDKKNTDAYFNVEILEQHKQTIYYLFNIIKKYWYNYTKSEPTKTQMHKLIVEINKKLNLGLPIVWYKYGQIVPIVYNQEKDYSDYVKATIIKVDESKIGEIINQNQRLSSNEMRDNQYKSSDEGLYKVYQIKKEMEKKIMNNDFKYVEENFKIFYEKTPYFKDDNKTIDRFFEMTQDYNQLEPKLQKDYEYKTIYLKTFELFWGLVAINNFKADLWNYYSLNNIKKERIDNCDLDLIKIKEEFNELKDLFYTKFIREKYKEDPIFKKMIED